MLNDQALLELYVETGARLRSERLRLALNQTEFGALGGTSLQTQMRYETGQKAPKLEYLFHLSGHGIDIGYIVTGVRMEGGAAVERKRISDLMEQLPANVRGALIDLLVQMAGPAIETARVQPTLHDRRPGYRTEDG